VSRHQETHPTYVEGCFGCKVSTLKIGYCRSTFGQDKSRANRIETELGRYEKAVRSGMQPESTRTPDIIRAEQWSEKHGQPYSAERAKAKNREILLETAVD
jgi:hypothetical protein